MNLSLRDIDESNRERCLSLSVTKEQEALIASNAKSLEWADRNPRCAPLGIYNDDAMIGFVMYEPRGNDVFSIHRFMIDQAYQGRGAGYQAMQLVMERIASLGGVTIYLSFRPENSVAQRLYEKLGFVFHIEEPDGEIVYKFGPDHELGNEDAAVCS